MSSKHRRAEAAHKHPQAVDPKQRLSSRAETLQSDVDDLLTPRKFSSWVGPDRRPGEPVPAVYRDDVREPDQLVERIVNRQRVEVKVKGSLIPIPVVGTEERRRRAGGFNYETDSHSLLEELEQRRDTSRSDVEMSSGRRTPSSRTPAGSQFAELLVDMTAGVSMLHRDALQQADRGAETTRRDIAGNVVDFQPTTAASLRALVDLIDMVDDNLARKITRSVHSWRNQARVLLADTAPMVRLQQHCRFCNQESLIVRADASSDVMCTTEGCEDENGRRPRWPRLQWAFLLAGGQ